MIELEFDDRPSLRTFSSHIDYCRDFESSENTVVTNVQPALLKTSLKGETHPGQYLPFILNRWSLWVTIFWHVSFWCPCAEDNIRLCMRLFVFLCMHSAQCAWTCQVCIALCFCVFVFSYLCFFSCVRFDCNWEQQRAQNCLSGSNLLQVGSCATSSPRHIITATALILYIVYIYICVLVVVVGRAMGYVM